MPGCSAGLPAGNSAAADVKSNLSNFKNSFMPSKTLSVAYVRLPGKAKT